MSCSFTPGCLAETRLSRHFFSFIFNAIMTFIVAAAGYLMVRLCLRSIHMNELCLFIGTDRARHAGSRCPGKYQDLLDVGAREQNREGSHGSCRTIAFHSENREDASRIENSLTSQRSLALLVGLCQEHIQEPGHVCFRLCLQVRTVAAKETFNLMAALNSTIPDFAVHGVGVRTRTDGLFSSW